MMHYPYTVELTCYEFICYNDKGEVLGEYMQHTYPVLADFPEGTVRVDIALP